MSLDKAYLRSKVVQGIKLMPYGVVVLREFYNKYNEKEYYIKVCELTGTKYTGNSRSVTLNMADSGIVDTPKGYKFLVDWNTESIKVQKGDYIFYKDRCFKLIEPNEDFEVYFDIDIEEVQGIVLDGDIVNENGIIYEVIS